MYKYLKFYIEYTYFNKLYFNKLIKLFLMQIHSHDFIILYIYIYILRKRELMINIHESFTRSVSQSI